MAHRKMKRAAVAAAGAAAAAAGQTKLSNVALDDGSAVLAPRADTSAIRDDGSWRVKEVPRCFKTFHDVICGASQHCFRRACHYCFCTTNNLCSLTPISIIFRCAFALDTLKSFSATERLLELLHFLHFGFYQNRAGDNFLVENWLLRLLRHFSGSRDPYVSVANVDVLELPRDSFSQEDVEYDRMMAIYQ